MLSRLLLLVCVGVVALQPSLVTAHSWYPERCCHNMDCFPADTVRRLADGTLVLVHGPFLVRVPQSCCAVDGVAVGCHVIDAQRHQIAAAQLAVDG